MSKKIKERGSLMIDESSQDACDGNIHVIPIDCRQPHVEDSSCWCHPTLTYRDEFTTKEVWTHKDIYGEDRQ